MERLTEKRGNLNVIPLRNAVCGVDLPYWCLNRHNEHEQFLSGNAADRLAAYEDTGLTPEEIEDRKEKWNKMSMRERLDAVAMPAQLFDPSITLEQLKRLDYYENAEDEGRLVVLPCKVGDEMWFIACKDVMHGRCRNISIHSGGIQITFDDDAGEPWTVGIKRVFDSRAEAEKAMEVSEA